METTKKAHLRESQTRTMTQLQLLEPERFDALARSLTTTGSRPRLLGALVLGSLGRLAVGSVNEAAAHDALRGCAKLKGKRKKKCIKKARAHNAEHDNPSSPVCDNGQTTCAGACFDLQSSEEHCGICGNQCTEREVCQAGDCCRPSFTLCTDVCAAGSNCSACCSGFCFSDNTC
jgi:hypothetical protein